MPSLTTGVDQMLPPVENVHRGSPPSIASKAYRLPSSEPTMTMGKSFDTHCPLGPAIVTPDELGDGSGLDLRTFVNGEIRQQSNTRELIFDVAALIEHLSTAFTLEVGDVISTGTPGGVAVAMKPPQWLVPGDVVRIEIDGIGHIENTVIEEPETATGF